MAEFQWKGRKQKIFYRQCLWISYFFQIFNFIGFSVIYLSLSEIPIWTHQRQFGFNCLSNNWLCNSKRYCSYLIYYYQNSNHSKFLHKIKMCCLLSKINSKIDICWYLASTIYLNLRNQHLQCECHFPNSPPGIIKLFPRRESLVSDIPAGDGKTANLFLQCTVVFMLEVIRRKDYWSVL